MKIAAMVLGLIGGVIGLVAAGFALAVGGIGSVVGAQGAHTVVGSGWAALALSVLGIVGAALALARPRFAAVLMIIAALGGLISVSWAYIVAFPLLLIGGLLAFFGRGSRQAETAPVVGPPAGA
jgi:hypothetical protein